MMARPERFELPTSWFVAMRSIQLSYGRVSRKTGGERGIRTLDGLLTHTPLAGERLRPLGHLSSAKSAYHNLVLAVSCHLCRRLTGRATATQEGGKDTCRNAIRKDGNGLFYPANRYNEATTPETQQLRLIFKPKINSFQEPTSLELTRREDIPVCSSRLMRS